MATINAPEFHKAVYTAQRIPQYAGNPLIEALPPLGGEEEVLRKFMSLPFFDVAQRDWTDHERVAMIAQLANFMVPLERHIQLAYCIDAMMRQGYVSRIPHSVRSQEIYKRLHQKNLLITEGTVIPQISTALIGVSGMGKTTSLKRYLSYIPQVIHHVEYGYYQIPYLHIEMPYDGASVAGLAHSIFRKVDMLLPGAEYMEQYATGKAGTETLMSHASRVLLMHSVGLLIVDEVQNLSNSPKNRQSLMTLLVTASNELGVPILFVGTSKARKLLTLECRQARRSVGFGVPLWERFEKHSPADEGRNAGPSDWDVVVQTLLNYSWVKKPIDEKTRPHLANLLYDLSQGIVDITIKLFAMAQVRAIIDGSEEITGQLLVDISKRDLSMVAPMIDALRRNDLQALDKLDDIKPVSLDELIAQTQIRYSGKQVAGASIGPATDTYNQMLLSALQVVGFDNKQAELLTTQSTELGAKNAIDGLQKVLKHATSGPKAKRAAKSDEPVAYEPGDYRSAQTSADSEAIEMFESLGMLPDLEELFPA